MSIRAQVNNAKGKAIDQVVCFSMDGIRRKTADTNKYPSFSSKGLLKEASMTGTRYVQRCLLHGSY
jgi:hypothetical protein